MVEALNKKKVPNTLSILENTYSSSDIITLQEVSSDFIDKASKSILGEIYHVIAPDDLDAVRDQNSVILLNRKTFSDIQALREITAAVTNDDTTTACLPYSTVKKHHHYLSLYCLLEPAFWARLPLYVQELYSNFRLLQYCTVPVKHDDSALQ